MSLCVTEHASHEAARFLPCYFYILKVFLKKMNFFSLLEINIFLCF